MGYGELFFCRIFCAVMFIDFSCFVAKSVLVPEGASKFESKLDEKATFKFDTEGVYIYECPPHKMMNMLGIIQVGKATNADKAKAAVPKLEKRVSENKGRLEKYATQIKE